MAETKIPEGLKYTNEHEWVRVEGSTGTVGITDFAQRALGEVTYVELPEVGAELTKGAEVAVVESLKAASDVYAPVSGTVVAVNGLLDAEPDKVNADPYGAGWLCQVEGVNQADLAQLLTSEQYRGLLAEEERSS